MKIIAGLCLCLMFSLFAFGQGKKAAPKPTPDAVPGRKIIESEARTKDGKTVILYSNKTWEYSKTEAIEINPIKKECVLELKGAPSFKGLNLEMRSKDIGKVFGVEDISAIERFVEPEELKNGVFLFRYNDVVTLHKYANFNDISQLNLSIYNDLLYSIKISYTDYP